MDLRGSESESPSDLQGITDIYEIEGLNHRETVKNPFPIKLIGESLSLLPVARLPLGCFSPPVSSS